MSSDLASPKILIGSWSVRRKVIDYRGGGALTFIGNAIITEHAFEEHGQFQVAGNRLDSRRHYRLNMEDDFASVLFPDGSHFVRLTCQPSQSVSHSCGDDSYHGRFIVRGPDQWAEIWSVAGPRKRYRSITLYRRYTPSTAVG
ncbi:DUF6314 family protein [Rhizobium tubonense]|uniref:DUF6314 domain-containing protein n=1 Tax=Rhizobium tubonense TaxID=484088 RepID=A0A2W4C0Y4_9HYPH|nr:DUF6314 family protein [Rhizobium tubonense]PZM07362.1 hypothetical protein CPY51_31925 [Rhizobium tubonense]